MLENFELVRIDEDQNRVLYCFALKAHCPDLNPRGQRQCYCDFYLFQKQSGKEFFIGEDVENVFDKQLRPSSLRMLDKLRKNNEIKLIAYDQIAAWEYLETKTDSSREQALNYVIFQENFLNRNKGWASRLKSFFKVLQLIMQK